MPSYQELVAGRRYLWCRCGRSKTQPFCDGSHAGTGFQPVAYVAKADKEEALFCMCKRTGTPPFCDGTHANLPGGYAEESAESIAASNVPWAPELDGGVHRLDGTCYTIRAAATRPANPGPFWMRDARRRQTGAAHQTQLYLEVRNQPSPALAPARTDADDRVHRRRQRHGRDRQPAFRGHALDGAWCCPVRRFG